MTELLFIVEDAPEGGFIARSHEHSIFTEANTFAELKEMIADAVKCHFEKEQLPKLIRLHYVKDELITLVA
jgi:predicted RNase H-like HicB family nuclease